ncbi:MAG: F0F1 ATP synthase subunit delta [Thermomicrobiales bacterium]
MASGSAMRYAQAVIELATDEGNFDRWQRDLNGLADLVAGPEASGFFANPNISNSEKLSVVQKVLPDLHPEALNLVKMLIERRKVVILPDVAALVDEADLASKGIVRVDVTTAEPLEADGQALVSRQLKQLLGRDVQLRMTVDPEIIGGIVARIGDQLIDGSVINQLRNLRARLAA